MASRNKKPLVQRRTPTQSRGRATVSAILEAAARILRAEGRAGFNTNRIAERAGVSIGTLYGYFPDKDAIYIALARRIIAEDGEVLTRTLDENDGAETIRVLIRTLFERHRHDRDVRRTVMSVYNATGHSAEHDRLVEDVIQALAARADRLFGRSVQPIDPTRLFFVTRSVIGIARGLTERGDTPPPSLEPLVQEAVLFVRDYLF